MNSKKSKVSLVIGLFIVLLICVYFRFIHAKVKEGTENQALSPPPPTVSLEVPQVEKAPPPVSDEITDKVPEALQEFVRDMFSPQSLTGRKPQTKALKKLEEEPPSFELKGTIVGKQRPIALIDDQFVRTGDWIDDYQVAHIGKKEVILASGDKKIRLEMIKND